MTLLTGILAFNFLMFFSEQGVSFGYYEVSRSLTIPGWIVLIILLLLTILVITEVIKLLIKNKEKLK